MVKISIAILFSILSFAATAQRVTVEEYIEQFKDIAMYEMKRSGIPASITLAQGILESENGNSELVKKSNNHFGIKCKSNWNGEVVTHDDDENGECFRAYANANASYRDHSNFLKFSARYSSLFRLDQKDYTSWALGLKTVGYATNPKYPDLLIKYIEQYDLQQYTLKVLSQLLVKDLVKENDSAETKIPIIFSKYQVNDTPFVTGIKIDADKVIYINKTKCVFVEKGTSLLVVANKKNISLSKLMDFNDIMEEGILSKSQYVYLHKKQKTGDTEFYISQPGETMYDMAQKVGIQFRYLLAYKNLNIGVHLNANTKLFLHPIFTRTTNKGGDKKIKLHFVAAKEGLAAIAKLYDVTVQQLKKWNKLVSDNLKIGQKILISK